jgi:hypothetical protein
MILDEGGAGVESNHPIFGSPMRLAVARGNKRMEIALISSENFLQAWVDMTPLYWMAEHGREDLVRLLLEDGMSM